MGPAARELVQGVWSCSARLCFLQVSSKSLWQCFLTHLQTASILRTIPILRTISRATASSVKSKVLIWKCVRGDSAHVVSTGLPLLTTLQWISKIITDMWRVQGVRAASICWRTRRVALFLSSLLSLTADFGTMDLACHKRSESNPDTHLWSQHTVCPPACLSVCLSACLSVSSLGS